MKYLVDAMIVSYFLQAGREKELVVAASKAPIVVVEEVRKELENDPTRGGKAFTSGSVKVGSRLFTSRLVPPPPRRSPKS